jgi:hypothetical protein
MYVCSLDQDLPTIFLTDFRLHQLTEKIDAVEKSR